MTPHSTAMILITVMAVLCVLLAYEWRKEPGRCWLHLVLLSLLLLMFGLSVHPARAHDHNRPGLDSWYSSLSSGKGPCCGGPTVDAKTLDGPDWGTSNGHYWVLIDGVRYDVPDDAVLNQPNLDGRALVWPIGGWGGITIRCFMPGSLM